MKKGMYLMVLALIAALSLPAFAGTVEDDIRIINTSALDTFEYKKNLDDDDLRRIAELSVSENPELFPTIESFEAKQDGSELEFNGSIDPEKEAKVSTLKKLVRRGRYLEAGDDLQAVMGKLLAENLHAKLGDEVVILGQARDGSIAASVFKVEGIYSSGQDEFDRSSIYVPLKTFQDVYGMGDAVHQVVAMGKTLQDVETIKQDISKHLAKNLKKDHLVVLDWKELMPGLIQSIKVDLGSGLIFYLILVVVVAFSILNTFLMAVFERTREFGVLLAVGTTPGRLTRLLLLESATMTLVGIMIGILLGCTVTLYFQSHGIAISGTAELMRQFGLPERMYPRLSLLSAAIGAGGVLIITLLTALYPALKVRRLHPVEAMTHVQAV